MFRVGVEWEIEGAVLADSVRTVFYFCMYIEYTISICFNLVR